MDGETLSDDYLSSNKLSAGVSSTTAQFQVQPTSANTVGQINSALPNQTADLHEWKDSSGNINCWMDSSANLHCSSATINRLTSSGLLTISTTTGFDTDASHTKDWPTQVWCLDPSFILCVDTAPLAYGQRVLIGTTTSLRHAGLQVQYSLAFKPTFMSDTLGVNGNAWQMRSESNSLFSLTVENWWQGTGSDTSTVILGAFQGPMYFYTKNSVTPILKLGTPTNENVEFRNGTSVSFEIDASSIAAKFPFYGKGSTSGASVPSGYTGEVISTKTVATINVGTNNQYFDIVSTGIAAGHWMIGANASYLVNGATFSGSAADFELGISQASGNDATGLSTGDNNSVSFSSANANGFTPLSVVDYELNIAAATTIYLKGFSGSYTAGKPQVKGRMTAVRLP